MIDTLRNSFVFYRSFFESISIINDDITKLQLYNAICGFALFGKDPENLSGIAKALWLSFRPQIEANRKKYINGVKGGAPKGNTNNLCGRRGKDSLQKTNQEPTKNQPNVNVNVNDSKKKENKKKEEAPISEEESKFNEWLSTNYRALADLQQPLTIAQYKILCNKYGNDVVVNKMACFCNTIYRNKTYRSAYLTINLWCAKVNKNG